MAGLALLVLLTLTFSHWIVEPFAAAALPLFSCSWLGWLGLVLVLWLFAGAGPSRPDTP